MERSCAKPVIRLWNGISDRFPSSCVTHFQYNPSLSYASSANSIPATGSVLVVVNFIISIYAIAGLFTLIFKYVPHAHISWRSAWRGALFTAILFTVGKVLLGVYLGVAFISSAYGAAGSVGCRCSVVYYSAQIFYYGAEFTCVNGRLRDAGVEAAGQLPSQAAKAAGI